jgi:hypothetical protein
LVGARCRLSDPANLARVMVEFTIVGFLLGVALSLHFRIFVLLPVIPLALAVVAISEGLLGRTISWIAVASALVLTSIQLGYLIGRTFVVRG